MSRPADLTVVIPMRDAGATIGRVLRAILSIPSARVEVIAVDDASTDDSVAQVAALQHPDVRVLSLARPSGAGVARNHGFAEASGTYTLFFDADDEIHPSAALRAIRALQDTSADLAFLPYRYRRGTSTTFEGMNSFDQTVWSHYLGAPGATRTPMIRVASLDEVPRLLGFSNYPWNKVVRTARYRRVGLTFGKTPVHNDILGHWQMLLGADSLVLVDDPLCTHVVTEDGKNLTNESSDIRLTLFDALDETYGFLAGRPELRNRYSHHYWDFALRVTGWAAQRIDAEHMPEFNDRLQRHLLRMNLVDFARIRRHRDPALANRIVRRVLS